MTGPTPEELLALELINHARADPQGEVGRLLDPATVDADAAAAVRWFAVEVPALTAVLADAVAAPPLAWSAALGALAGRHSDLMILHDRQAHALSDEPGLLARIEDAGYVGARRVAENVFAYATSPLQGHVGFYIDWGDGPGGVQDPPGHRLAMLGPTYIEAGIDFAAVPDGLRTGPFATTQHFGLRSGVGPVLTGVVIADSDGDAFYDPGEGIGGVRLRAMRADGAVAEIRSGAAGDHALELSAWTWRVEADGPGLAAPVAWTAEIAAVNVKRDVTLGPDGRIPPVLLSGGAGDDSLAGGAGSDLADGDVDRFMDFNDAADDFDYIRFVGVRYDQLRWYEQGSSAVVQIVLDQGGSAYLELVNFDLARLSDQCFLA